MATAEDIHAFRMTLERLIRGSHTTELWWPADCRPLTFGSGLPPILRAARRSTGANTWSPRI